ncbi:MAG TPA: aminotransferase class V-fold PLP-dependent enzyme, partial [Pseudomonadota bacterium]|nr:aminotransferase class V-fold PLP-dependent enzyme [Pseudomonadota bacterium]
ITLLPVDAQGRLGPAALRAALDAQPASLVSLSLCNHELGNLYPIAELARAAHAAGARFHCDAVQAAGRVPIDVRALEVDLLTLSAHKLAGPKGVGALYCRGAGSAAGPKAVAGELAIAPLLVGGQQEKGRRAGTENVPGIVGLGRACKLARERLATTAVRIAELRDRLEGRLLALPGARRHGDPEARAPGTANLAFAGVEGELLFMNLDLRGVAVSTGAACSSGSPEPSPVLLALGLLPGAALEAVRFSLGSTNTEVEVDQVAAWVEEIILQVRALAAPSGLPDGLSGTSSVKFQ